MSIPCIWLQVINIIKVTYQSEGHIKVKVKISTSFHFYVYLYLLQHINPVFVATSH